MCPLWLPLLGRPELVAHERDRVLFVGGPVRDGRVFRGCSTANQAAINYREITLHFGAEFSLWGCFDSARSVSDRSLTRT